jgi:hypothetical protein
VHYAILDGGYLVAPLSFVHIIVDVLYSLRQGTICNLPWVKILRVHSLHAQSNDLVDHRQIYNDAPIQPQVIAMVARQEEFNAHINLLMSVEVCYLHHIKNC